MNVTIVDGCLTIEIVRWRGFMLGVDKGAIGQIDIFKLVIDRAKLCDIVDS